MKKSILKIAGILAGALIFIYDAKELLGTVVIHNMDEFIIYYFRLFFTFFALPLFAIAKLFEYLDYIDKNNYHYYQIKLFYDTVYIFMVIYILAVGFDKLFG
jgi:hypothetical protein